MTFVTCIYNYGPGTVIGGRGYDLSFYLPTLINISKLGFPLVLFTLPQLVNDTKDSLKEYFTSGIEVVGYELESFRHFEKFIKWKQEILDLKTYYNARNEILCYTKALWLKEAADKNYFNDSVFSWIDAGLTHHGIFPECKGGVELMTKPVNSFYYPHNESNIFTPILGEKMFKKMNTEKMFFCATQWQGDKKRFEDFLIRNFNKPTVNDGLSKHLVAGIFGGKIETINKFYNLYNAFIDKIIEDKIYCLEEEIFSSMNVLTPELFECEYFSVWHFYSPGERTSYLEGEGDSFYKIFERI